MFKGTMTKIADAAQTTQHLLVKFGTDADHIAIATAAGAPIGACPDTPALGDSAAVILIGVTDESVTMVASEAITVGERVFAAAAGKISDLPAAAASYFCVGQALEAAAEDGDEIQIASCVPFTVTVAAG
jgi:hypothetical protein